MTGRIFNIQKFCISDGPGIRTTVFLKGCNLKCEWCHNPESQSFEKEQIFHKNKCTGCGRCKNISEIDENFVCYNEAKEICGKDYTVDEVLHEILKDKSYYKTSGGGVTFSGGECMLQIAFLQEILKGCKKNEVHTAVDTAGHIPWENFEKILPYTNIFLYDVKLLDDEKHRIYTGVSNRRILENLAKLLSQGACVWVRMPVIPGVNDTEEEMKHLKAYFDIHGYPEKLELLPYHKLGEHKYAELGKPVHAFAEPDRERIAYLKSVVLSKEHTR